MNRKIFIVIGSCVIVMVLFVAGFFVGRNSLDKTYSDIVAAERPLLGRWQFLSPVDSLRSTIELRPDRKAIIYNDQGQASLVADWGSFGNRLSIQNGHVPGEPGNHYMPPAVFDVSSIDDHKLHLVTVDGSVTWELNRL